MKKSWGKLLETVVGVVGGNAVLAFAVVAFILPQGTIMGGATGIGLTISHYMPINLSLVILSLNGIFFILGAVILGKKFAVTTLASSVIYPLMLSIMQSVSGIANLTDSEFLSLLYGGVLLGVGIGLIVRVGSSTGGTDSLALVINKGTHISVAMLLYIIDFLVLAMQSIFSSGEQILYGILNLVVSTLVLNKVMLLGKSQIQLFVISDNYEIIREMLLKTANVGATMVLIESGYESIQKKGVLCVISNRKLYHINEMIHHIDPQAFITISQINEVRGRGFSMDRISYDELKKNK